MHLFQYQTYQEEDEKNEEKCFETQKSDNDYKEDITKKFNSDDAVLANRLLAKNSILAQTTPDKAITFLVDEKIDGTFEPPE